MASAIWFGIGVRARRMLRKALAGASAALLACGAEAVGPGDAAARDAQLRALEDQRRAQAQRSVDPPPVLQLTPPTGPRRAAVAGEQPCRVIQSVQLTGPHAARFSWAMEEFEPFAGHCLGPRSLQALLLNLNDALLVQGNVTSRFVLEPQDLSTGVLTVALKAGLIDRIEWTDGERAIPGDPHALPTAAGDVLDVRDLDQALENLARLPSVATRIQIEPGTQPHTSTVRIEKHRTGRRWRGQLGLDNSGPREFGRTRFNAWVGVDAPLGWADQLSLGFDSNLEQVARDHRSTGVNGAWSVPLGYHLFTYSQSASHTGRAVAGTTLRFHLAGSDRQRELKWRGTLLRTPLFRLDAFASTGQRHGRTQLDDIELIVQRRDSRRREGGLSLLVHAGVAEVEASLSEARTVRQPLPDAFRNPGEPDAALMQRLQLDVNVAVDWLAEQASYSARLDAQRTRHPLAVSTPVVLGSRDTVRGYTGEHTLSAPSGTILRQELRWPALSLPVAQALVQPYVAADLGLLDGHETAALPRRKLAGVAVGARLQHARWSADVMLASPVRAPKGFPGTDLLPYLSFSVPL
jgi:hemolysin activation/secretion protein